MKGRAPLLALALAAAACQGRAPTAREELLRGGMAVTPDAFVEAAQRGDVRAVRLYLRAGLDPDAEDALGRTPLVAAVDGGSAEVATALLDAGASLTGCTRSPAPGALSPLFAAAVRGNVALAELLLARGADPEQGCDGTTPGDEAARFGRTAVVRLLRAHGARITYDPLREKAREAAAKLLDSAEALRGSFVAHGAVLREVRAADHPDAVAKVAAKRYFLAQLLAVRLRPPGAGAREVLLATNQTRFVQPGPLALRVRAIGFAATPRGDLELLVEDVHHEASLYLQGRLRAARDDAYVAYAVSLLPAALEGLEAPGAAADPRSRAERALLALPGALAAELERVEERSVLAQELVPFTQGLVRCRLQREHPLTADADRARLAEVLWDAAAQAAATAESPPEPPSHNASSTTTGR